jgi:hypothetical protein
MKKTCGNCRYRFMHDEKQPCVFCFQHNLWEWRYLRPFVWVGVCLIIVLVVLASPFARADVLGVPVKLPEPVSEPDC